MKSIRGYSSFGCFNPIIPPADGPESSILTRIQITKLWELLPPKLRLCDCILIFNKEEKTFKDLNTVYEIFEELDEKIKILFIIKTDNDEIFGFIIQQRIHLNETVEYKNVPFSYLFSISPELKKIDDLNSFSRYQEPPKSGLMCDILWSDPIEKDEEAKNVLYMPNSARNCSYIFGAKAAKPFLDKNKYLSIVRAHETQLEGFKMHQWDKDIDFPSVITIFSAPNYCDVYGNKAAVIKINNNMINIQQYNYSPHPFTLPDYMNIFSWSIPFVSEKISEMLLQIIKKQDLDHNPNNDSNIIEENVTESLRMKVKIITVLMKMFRTLREERELIMKLKGFCPGNKIPRGILIQGPKALKSALERYKNAKKLDGDNEMMPKNYK